MEENLAGPIVIVGARRSGTTLLRSMLSNHPELVVHPSEPQFLLELYERHGAFIDDLDTALTYVEAHRYRAPGVKPSKLRQAFADVTSLSLADFSRRYVKTWLTVGGQMGARPVLKHPRLVFQLDLLYTLFPHAVVVNVVRDARANVSSQLARWPTMSLWEAACWWRDAVRAARDRPGGKQLAYTELKYEDLVLNPAMTLQLLCRELTISYHPRLLDFEIESRRYAIDTPPQAVRLTSTDPSRVDLWRQRLSPLQLRLIEACCWREMALWGYELARPDVPALQFVMGLAWQQLRYLVFRGGRQLKEVVRRSSWRLQDRR